MVQDLRGHFQQVATACTLSAFTCRYVASATGDMFAVKRLNIEHHVYFPFLLENEVNG